VDVKLYEHGTNWLIEAQLPEDLLNELDNEVNGHLNDFLSDKENYTCKGDSVLQYWLQKQGTNYIQNDSLVSAVSDYGKFMSEICSKVGVFDPSFLSHLRPYGIWTVRGDEGSFHKMHQHNAKGSVLGLATVSYLNVPSTNDDDQPNNNVYFVMNSSENTVFSTNIPNVVEVSPRRGQMFIFPNWLLHGTYPQSAGLRQTFNVDYLAI